MLSSNKISAFFQRIRFELSATQLILFSSFFLVLFSNTAFWQAFFSISNPFVPANISFTLAELLFLVAALNFLLSFFAWPYLLRPTLMLLMFIAAFSSYFMNAYGILIDSDMIQNVVETDVREASELLTFNLIPYVLILGVLPAFLIWRTKLVFRSWPREIGLRVLVMTISVVLIGVALASHFKQFSITGREHKELRMMINPAYPIYAFGQYIKGAPAPGAMLITPIAVDAAQAPQRKSSAKKKILVMVVGETARDNLTAQALYEKRGYQRDNDYFSYSLSL